MARNEPEEGRWVPLAKWLAPLLMRHRSEIERRAIALRVEVEDSFAILPSETREHAVSKLLAWIVSMVPDHCEIYIGAARSRGSVSRLGEGAWHLRWQVVGKGASGVRGEGGESVSIHPRPGGAPDHAQSAAARRVGDAFLETGWVIEIDPLPDSDECIARIVASAGA